MILAVNIGNTNIRAAIGNDSPFATAVFPAEPVSNADDFVNAAEEYFGHTLWAEVEGCVISSVVPRLTLAVAEALRHKTKKEPRRIDVRNCGGLNTARYSGALGEDRAVCCAYALQKYSLPLIVADFGTATTINLVGEDGGFLGGAIMPGVQIGLNSLSGGTAQLPRIIAAKDEKISVVGKNTEENLLAGAIIGAACAAEGFIRRIEAEQGRAAAVIVTGGHSGLLLPYFNFKYIYEPDLLLNGLFALYKNSKEIIVCGN